jgi:hypothetical protein
MVTPNYNFPLHTEDEFFEINDFNEMMTVVDTELKNMSDASENVVTDAKAAAEAVIGGKSDKSTKVDATIQPADWTGTEAPYRAAVAVEGVTETNIVEVLLNTNAAATDAEKAALVEACSNANITGGTQTAGEVTLEAYGDKPETALPLIFIVRGDL